MHVSNLTRNSGITSSRPIQRKTVPTKYSFLGYFLYLRRPRPLDLEIIFLKVCKKHASWQFMERLLDYHELPKAILRMGITSSNHFADVYSIR